MLEPATTLTDFLMAAISLVCAVRQRRAQPSFQGPILFFLAFAMAAALGGLWHGFLGASSGLAGRVVWWLSMCFGGLSSAGLALAGLELLGVRRGLRAGLPVFAVAFGAYVWMQPAFVAAIVASACGTLICLAGLLYRLRQQPATGPLLGIAALALSAAGAFVQQRGIALDPNYFDHNATYHLFLLVSLGMFHAGLRRISL